MPQIALTQEFIRTNKCPPDKKKVDYFDTICPNLLYEKRISGGSTYYLRYQDTHGITRQIKLGNGEVISLHQARQLAHKLKNRIAMGEDPLLKKAEVKKYVKFETFVNETYLPFIQTYKRSWKCDRGLLNNHVLPVFGHLLLNEVSKQSIIQFIAEHCKTHAPGSVNRIIILLRYIFNLAIKWEIVGLVKNPTTGIPLLEENNKIERYLNQEETQRLFEAVRNSDNPYLQYVIPFLILTGARKREGLDARWEDFDFDRRQWCIPVTKAGRPRYVPLSNGVINLLAHVPRIDQNPWVFPNPKTGKPYQSIYGSWNHARKEAGLADVRIHDLRHSFASNLINAGRSLYEVQRILGHTQIKTTQRYAHLSQDTLLDAADAASQSIGVLHFAPQIIKPAQLGYRNV